MKNMEMNNFIEPKENMKFTTDISNEIITIMNMTPCDGYHMKLDLINKAEDMNTKEKIDAINKAEDKYAQDLKRSADLVKIGRWQVHMLMT